MIEFRFEMPSGDQVKQRLAAGYRARRNFLLVELFGMIVLGTPVLTGEARGGWRVTIGGPTSGADGRLDPDGMETIMMGLAALKGASAFAPVFISNQVDYIDDLENGSSLKAPEGMVKINLAAWRNMYGSEVL